MIQPQVYLDGYSWDIRSRNSDWSYVERKMPRVADWAPDVEFVHQRSPRVMLRANYKAFRAAISRRMGHPIAQWTADTDYLDAGELLRSRCNVVFSHREFPLNSSDVPVIWMSAILDPEMVSTFFKGNTESMDEEFRVKSQLFRKATVVQVCTHAEAARHAQIFPDIADRFVPVPLFGPHLKAAPESLLRKHRSASPIKLLFVGNAVRRKGLRESIDAYSALPESVRKRTEFTIVSHFDGKQVNIPEDARIKVRGSLNQADVLGLMAASHILITPSHFESYGMVFLEAMSQGTLCIGPDWEVQRELFDGGRAGMNVRCEVPLVRDALLRAIEDDDHRLALATAGWHRFNQLYAPEVVAGKYADLFRWAANR